MSSSPVRSPHALRWIAAASAFLVAAVISVAVVGASFPSLVIAQITPGATATREIPPVWIALYVRAAASCPGLPWTVLAAIGTVESDNGSSSAAGVSSGSNAAGAEGPMQFLPATFAEYDEPVPSGGVDPPSPYDPTDAVFAAARMLCSNGARGEKNIPGAIFAYNHDVAYVNQVLALAASFSAAGSRESVSQVASVAIDYAFEQLGTPYRWGGETPGVGFDCSGLVQAAYAAAGVSLPRVAQDQFDAGPRLALGASLLPGDLVFFGTGPSSISHVGIVIAPGQMIDAPYTGADVRVDPFPDVPGDAWGDEVFVGATRPWS